MELWKKIKTVTFASSHIAHSVSRVQQLAKHISFSSRYAWDLPSLFTVSLWMTASTGAMRLNGVIQAAELGKCVWTRHAGSSLPLRFRVPADMSHQGHGQEEQHARSSVWCPLFAETMQYSARPRLSMRSKRRSSGTNQMMSRKGF